MKTLRWLTAVAWLCCGNVALAASLVAGRALYAVCAGCHGFQAEGQAAVNAPKLTGLEDWYIARQLRDFERGIRGAQTGDEHGATMAPFALALPDERAVEDLVAYVATLPHEAPEPTVAGDTERGRQSYTLCGACHGEDGRGNEQLSSPALVGRDDWYVVRQLELYRVGLRGTHAQDTYGRQMQPIATALGDEQQLRDVALYILSLGGR